MATPSRPLEITKTRANYIEDLVGMVLNYRRCGGNRHAGVKNMEAPFMILSSGVIGRDLLHPQRIYWSCNKISLMHYGRIPSHRSRAVSSCHTYRILLTESPMTVWKTDGRRYWLAYISRSWKTTPRFKDRGGFPTSSASNWHIRTKPVSSTREVDLYRFSGSRSCVDLKHTHFPALLEQLSAL